VNGAGAGTDGEEDKGRSPCRWPVGRAMGMGLCVSGRPRRLDVGPEGSVHVPAQGYGAQGWGARGVDRSGGGGPVAVLEGRSGRREREWECGS
jgi:hypothetical protein